MRLLGVDWGSKRIGLAIAEAEAGLPSPRPALTASGSLCRDAAAIVDVARKEEADAVILGVPLNEGDRRMEGVMKQLSELIEAEGFSVELQDESLTTVQADSRIAGSGLKGSQRRRRKDAEAACILLERYIDAQAH